jgi:hypothetical protein
MGKSAPIFECYVYERSCEIFVNKIGGARQKKLTYWGKFRDLSIWKPSPPVHKAYCITHIFMHVDNNLCNNYGNEISYPLERM